MLFLAFFIRKGPLVLVSSTRISDSNTNGSSTPRTHFNSYRSCYSSHSVEKSSPLPSLCFFPLLCGSEPTCATAKGLPVCYDEPDRELRGEAAAKGPPAAFRLHSSLALMDTGFPSRQLVVYDAACTPSSRYYHLVLLQYRLLVLLVAGCSSVSCARSCRCCHFTARKSAQAAATKVELIGRYLPE